MSLRVRPLKWSMIYPGEMHAETGFGSVLIARRVEGISYVRMGLDKPVTVDGSVNDAMEAAENLFAERVRACVLSSSTIDPNDEAQP